MEMIKLLVRIVIGFIWIYQLISVDCKVITVDKQHVSDAIDPSEWHSVSRSGRKFEETSIKQTNGTSRDLNALTTPHMPFHMRSFIQVRSIKRSLKKIWLTYAYYAPEFSLCSCLFKYAWYTYPIIPEVTYAAMGRAQRMIGNFMQDFVQGFMENRLNYDQERISGKVAQTTADDYYDYQTRYANVRRKDNLVSPSIEEEVKNIPYVPQKVDPKLASVLEMLKNLKPKTSQNDSFIIRYERALNTRNAVDPAFIIMEIQKFFQKWKSHGDLTKSIRSLNETKTGDGGRSYPAPFTSPNNIKRIHTQYGPPPGLPSFNELPPADYHYYKDGVYHHVHDLRKNKHPPTGGGFFSVDFQDAILSALGLTPPGKSIQPTVAKCGKTYLIHAILRKLQALLLGK